MHQGDTNNYQEEVSIPVKISDSIFMGDEVIAHDIEWLTLNQITHVINCAGRHCPNNTTVKGMCFLTFDWTENNVQHIIDSNVVNAVVGFIEEARREHGTVLIHGYRSQSRPFCLLAIYFMVKFQWNIYKALEYLNSRREGTQVDQVFIHQLNTLHARLQQRGMIRSKQWIVTPETTEQQLLLHNTFLNSRKRNTEDQKFPKKKKKNIKNIAWKTSISTEHIYSENAPIAQMPQTRPSILEPKQRSQSANSRKGQESRNITGKILTAKQSIKADKANECNKKMDGAERGMDAIKVKSSSKLPHMYISPNTEVPRSSDTPLYVKKEQKINDRLHEKINVLKSQAGLHQPSKPALQANNSKDQLNRSKQQKDSSISSMVRRGKETQSLKKEKDSKKQGLITLLNGDQGKESRIAHNNWIISNQILKQSGLRNQKQPSSKSVIVVKPNHALQPSQNSQNQQRSSIKKATSQRKPQKQDATKKFFGDDNPGLERGRCSSVKQQKRQSSTIMKTSSLTGKNKWKL